MRLSDTVTALQDFIKMVVKIYRGQQTGKWHLFYDGQSED
jgi:hypothetical protein